MLLKDAVSFANTGLDAIKRAPIVDYYTGYKCLRIQDITQDKPFLCWGNTNVSQQDKEKFSLKQGDIIIARTGATVGVNKFIKNNLESVYNNGLIRLKIKPDFIPLYIFSLLQTTQFSNYIKGVSCGTSAQPNLQIGDLLDYKFKGHSYIEQQHIVDILGSIDDSIENNEKIIHKINDLALLLIQTNEIANTELKKVIKFIKGKKPIGNDNFLAPYLSIEAITSGKYEEASSAKMIMAEPFDILMVMDGASSGTVYSHQEGIVSSTLAKLEVNDSLNDYIYWYLVSMKDTIRTRNTGSAIPHANKDYICSLKFNIDVASNVALRNKLHELRNKIILLQRKNKQLKELKSYYLKKFFD